MSLPEQINAARPAADLFGEINRLEPVGNVQSEEVTAALSEIERLDSKLAGKFSRVLTVEPALTRKLVSFQDNKGRDSYRWFKYKEAFSAALVKYLLTAQNLTKGRILDPFAGMGTTLFAANELGIAADGIELLPIGQTLIATRVMLEREFSVTDFEALRRWKSKTPWKSNTSTVPLPSLRITHGAYSQKTLQRVEAFTGAMGGENERVRAALRLALLCILEPISFTRKDGQYLRWDHRSGRRQGARPFNKGTILDFDQAMVEKLSEILSDTEPGPDRELFAKSRVQSSIKLFHGSCIEVMPTLAKGQYDAILTSPPYCNRYDYTRTYALELALLGVGEERLAELRQAMLSCTVENRAKDLGGKYPGWSAAIKAADNQKLLQAILRYLEDRKKSGDINNNGIPRMVRGYFYEMACLISECARVLKPNAPFLMVNDNVRYCGASVSVDLILSDIAEKLGLRVEKILVLPGGKGNSSQQMGEHGREPLRKCVYVWRKMG